MSASDRSGAERASAVGGGMRGRLWARFRRSRMRDPLRRAVLLAMRPYAGRQDALNAEIMRELERHGERLDRLEQFTRELVLASESLRRGLQEAQAAGGDRGRSDRERDHESEEGAPEGGGQGGTGATAR